jgi:hypothetical protein
MRTLFITLIATALSLSGAAQQTLTVLAKGETTLEGSLPQEMMYAFENFREAKIVMNNGSETSTRVNINLYTGDVLFFTPSNQVLVLAYPLDVKNIVIQNTNWIQIKGSFWEVKSTEGPVNLVAAKKTRIVNTRKEAGYGGTTSTSSVGRMSSFTMNGGQNYTPLPVGEYDFKTDFEFMLANEKTSSFATAKTFKKFFPEKKKQIDEYLKTNEVNFQSEKDLIAFLEVCRKM